MIATTICIRFVCSRRLRGCQCGSQKSTLQESDDQDSSDSKMLHLSSLLYSGVADLFTGLQSSDVAFSKPDGQITRQNVVGPCCLDLESVEGSARKSYHQTST